MKTSRAMMTDDDQGPLGRQFTTALLKLPHRNDPAFRDVANLVFPRFAHVEHVDRRPFRDQIAQSRHADLKTIECRHFLPSERERSRLLEARQNRRVGIEQDPGRGRTGTARHQHRAPDGRLALAQDGDKLAIT